MDSTIVTCDIPLQTAEIYCWCCSACIERRVEKKDRRNSHKDLHSKENFRHSPYPIVQDSSSPQSIPGSKDTHHRRCQFARSVDDKCNLCQKSGQKISPTAISGSAPILLPDHTLPKSPKIGSMPPGRPVPFFDGCQDNPESALQGVQSVDGFLQNNRLEHMNHVLGYHPQYLTCFHKCQQYILRGDGPLPYNYRHFIAIMAAARHQCSYLVNIQIREFLLAGGDERWLNGLEHIPKKLRDLAEINKILAHRPWLINKKHLEKLTRGENNWSVSEVMHAIVLLSHFHALSSFIYGCGISAELEAGSPTNGSHNVSPVMSPGGSPPSNKAGSTEEESRIETLMARMKSLNEGEPEDVTEEELKKRFEKVEHQSAEMPASQNKPSPRADILRFIEDGEFTYQDFAKRGTTSDIPTFRAQDYSWDDHGFSLANRLFPDTGSLLDDKFSITQNLTYMTMGDNLDVDTSPFRRAIWNYIHCMFGIRHDDYDYSEVNHLLERGLKAYVKTVTCYPERITRRDYDNFMREFKHSEKVHVNIMILEARLQAELLYALRAVMRYMT